MDIATSLRLTAARTTPTADVTPAPRSHTPTPRASTSTESISTDVVIIILARVTVIGLWDSAITEEFIHTPVVVLAIDSITLVIAIITYSIKRVQVPTRPDILYYQHINCIKYQVGSGSRHKAGFSR